MRKYSRSRFTEAASVLSVPTQLKANRFLAFTAKPLARVSLGDVQSFAGSLSALAQSSKSADAGGYQELVSLCSKDRLLPLLRRRGPAVARMNNPSLVSPALAQGFGRGGTQLDRYPASPC